jgi:hypothetical protein
MQSLWIMLILSLSACPMWKWTVLSIISLDDGGNMFLQNISNTPYFHMV